MQSSSKNSTQFKFNLDKCCPQCPFKVRSSTGMSQHRRACPAHKQHFAELVKGKVMAGRSRKLAAIEKATREDSERLKPSVEQEAPRLEDEPVQGLDSDILPPHVPARPKRSTARRLPKRYQDFIPQGPGRLVKSPASQAPQQKPPSTPNDQDRSYEADETSTHPPEKRPRLADGATSNYQTEANSFGLYRRYSTPAPPSMPDSEAPLSTMDDTPSGIANPSNSGGDTLHSIIHPFPNESAFLFGHHITCSGETKSKQDGKALFSFITADEVIKEELKETGLHAIKKALDKLENPFQASDEWKSSTIDIDVPLGRNPDNPKAPFSATYTVPQPLYHRSLTESIKGAFSRPPTAGQGTESFHYEPFEQWWIPPKTSGETAHQRVYDELYTSQAWIDEHEKLQKLPKEPGCDLPRVIAGCMVWSDSTQTSNFGQNGSMWPIYLFFGNQSKYERAKLASNAGVHVGYIPKLSSAGLHEFIQKQNPNAKNTQPIITHCRRELMHGVWGKMLDDDFIHAYQHGIVIVCGDGVRRRVYPRLFTYSVDYPEKVLLATIRDFGGCPCVRCFIPIDKIKGVGSKQDGRLRSRLARIDDLERKSKVNTARRLIYELGYPVNSQAVERILKDKSRVPTKNVFSERLSSFGFDFHDMLVVDLLHEYELGVWKSVFTHLLRLVEATNKHDLNIVNQRYNGVPPFGDSVIRNFTDNTVEMKKLAARDFEDLLQCSIPVFEGLFPDEHDRAISKLLFVLCYWHALAKLRRHTDKTLQNLATATSTLGAALRNFVEKTCEAFKTFELPKEVEARLRRAQTQVRRGVQSLNPPPPSVPSTESSQTCYPVSDTGTSSSSRRTLDADSTSRRQPSHDKTRVQKATGRQPKTLSLKTVKLHSLADYTANILRFGTTDSYSTQRGESEHAALKRVVRSRTNKRDPALQAGNFIRAREIMSQKYETYLEFKARGNGRGSNSPDTPETNASSSGTQVEPGQGSDPTARYHISQYSHSPVNINKLTRDHTGDPAYKDFLIMLQDHILARIHNKMGEDELPVFSTDKRDNLKFSHDRLYTHTTLRINYTSYDLRREQDYISVSKKDRCNIMVASSEDPCSPSYHPYWYGHVEKIFHVMAYQVGREGLPSSSPKRFDVLWICWYGYEKGWKGGFAERMLDRVGFILEDNQEAYGFLDPSDVIRACHLIPAFRLDRDLKGKGSSSVQDSLGDWKAFYVNRFVDRDMLMRYLGGGIGHVESVTVPKEELAAAEVAVGSYIDTEEPMADAETRTAVDLPEIEQAADNDGYEEVSEDEAEDGFNSDALSGSDRDCDERPPEL